MVTIHLVGNGNRRCLLGGSEYVLALVEQLLAGEGLN